MWAVVVPYSHHVPSPVHFKCLFIFIPAHAIFKYKLPYSEYSIMYIHTHFRVAGGAQCAF